MNAKRLFAVLFVNLIFVTSNILSLSMEFKSKKDALFTIVIFGLSLFFIGMAIVGSLNGRMSEMYYWPILIILAVTGLLLWLYFGTSYTLNADAIHYRSGPFKGSIALDRIREVASGKTMYVGFKPATARNGLIIKYDKYEEIYISPLTNETFIEAILKLKSDIKITSK